MSQKTDIICDINELAQLAPLSIMCFNCEGRITFINDWHLKNFARNRRTRESYLGELITNLPGIASSGLADRIEEVLHGNSFHTENVFTSEFSGGQSGYQSIRAIPVEKDERVIGGIVIREDITKFILAERKLVDTERKVSTLINAIEDSAILIDTNGTFLALNKEAARRRDLEVQDLLGKCVYDYLPEESSSARRDALKRACDEKVAIYYDEIHGEKKYHVSVHPILDDIGEVKELASYSRDITEQTKYSTQLLLAKEKAESADLVKSQFLANVSHELRTPLNGILGMSQLIAMNTSNEEILQFASHIVESAERLTNVINNIIDLSDIESRSFEPIIKEFNLKEAIRSVCDSYAVQASLKNLKLISALDEDIPDYVMSDKFRIGQSLSYLITNAIQSTQSGHITISVKRSETLGQVPNRVREDRVLLRFSVTDTGVGIPEERIPMLFESFTLAEDVHTKSRSGLGIGLSIANRLICALGGNLSVESEVGVGSCFSFELGMAIPQDVHEFDLYQLLSEPQTVNLAGKTSILAEDEEISEIYARHILEGFGCKVFVARSGLEVLSLLKDIRADFILMDIQMPLMDGIEATRHIRSGEIPSADRNIPIIALTAFAGEKDKDRFISCGMNNILSKPFNYKQLEKVIKAFLSATDC